MICSAEGLPVSTGGNMGWADRLATWLTAQSFNNVLLVMILGVIFGGGYYAIKEAIPAHLKTIQEGYDRLDASHRAERKEAITQYLEERKKSDELHTEQTKTIVSGFEKATDRNVELIQDLINRKGSP